MRRRRKHVHFFQTTANIRSKNVCVLKPTANKSNSARTIANDSSYSPLEGYVCVLQQSCMNQHNTSYTLHRISGFYFPKSIYKQYMRDRIKEKAHVFNRVQLVVSVFCFLLLLLVFELLVFPSLNYTIYLFPHIITAT